MNRRAGGALRHPAAIAVHWPGDPDPIGNFVEPRVLGRSVELQPLAVLLALMFWGVLWGPMGILLATPVTGILALLASYSPFTQPIATVLSGKLSSSGPDQRSGAS